MSDIKKTTTKSEEAKTAKSAATLAKAEAVNLESSLAGITKASLEAQEAFADVGKRLITKYEELGAVEDAIKLKKEDLKTLHGQDKILLSISELEAEKVKIEVANKQLEDDLKVARDREEAQFSYDRDQKRKKADDDWAEEVRVRKLQEKERQEAFDKDHKARNEALAAQEKQYQDAIAKAATFDTEVANKVKAEVGKETGILTARFEAEKKLTAVEHKAVVDGLNKDIVHLKETVTAKDAEIASLNEKLSRALDAQTTLAKATVESATNTKALADAQALITNVGNGARPTGRA